MEDKVPAHPPRSYDHEVRVWRRRQQRERRVVLQYRLPGHLVNVEQLQQEPVIVQGHLVLAQQRAQAAVHDVYEAGEVTGTAREHNAAGGDRDF